MFGFPAGTAQRPPQRCYATQLRHYVTSPAPEVITFASGKGDSYSLAEEVFKTVSTHLFGFAHTALSNTCEGR